MSRRLFASALKKRGFRLDARSLLLFTDEAFFLNGETVEFAQRDRETLARLADRRQLEPAGASSDTLEAMLYEWYLDGFGYPGARP